MSKGLPLKVKVAVAVLLILTIVGWWTNNTSTAYGAGSGSIKPHNRSTEDKIGSGTREGWVEHHHHHLPNTNDKSGSMTSGELSEDPEMDYRIEELLSNDHIIGWDEALADITNGTTR